MTNRTKQFQSQPLIKHPFLMFMMFIAAYFTTVSLKANAQDTMVTGDAVQLQSNDNSLITGTITAVDREYFDMVSNESELRVYLLKVDMKGPASSVLSPGMNVSVSGEIRGEEFGRTIVRAKNVVASHGAVSTYIPDPNRVLKN